MNFKELPAEVQLARLRVEIEYARKKAADYRKRAAAQDAIADAKVKEAAALGTPLLFEQARGDGDSSYHGVSDV